MLPTRRLVVGLLLYLAVVKNVGRGDEPRTDRHGDPLPEGAVARLGSTRLLHDDWIRNLAFFPDGKSLMAATNEPFVRIWDAASGRQLRRIGETDSSLMCAALSPDGRTMGPEDRRSRHQLGAYRPDFHVTPYLGGVLPAPPSLSS